MCFRPNEISRKDGGIQRTTCSTCGMPVEAEAGVTSGTCPYCGDPIPSEPPDDFSEIDPSYSTRIL